jgi:hypothetical protein
VTEAQFFLALEPTNDSSIISFLLGSAEYRSRAIVLNPGIVSNDQKVVNQMFHDLLGRNATGSELDFFAGQLESGTPAATVANAILGSNEYFAALINQTYLRMLATRRVAKRDQLFPGAIKGRCPTTGRFAGYPGRFG